MLEDLREIRETQGVHTKMLITLLKHVKGVSITEHTLPEGVLLPLTRTDEFHDLEDKLQEPDFADGMVSV